MLKLYMLTILLSTIVALSYLYTDEARRPEPDRRYP